MKITLFKPLREIPAYSAGDKGQKCGGQNAKARQQDRPAVWLAGFNLPSQRKQKTAYDTAPDVITVIEFRF